MRRRCRPHAHFESVPRPRLRPQCPGSKSWGAIGTVSGVSRICGRADGGNLQVRIGEGPGRGKDQGAYQLKSRTLLIAAQLCAAALLAVSAHAATLHVPSEYPTIQAGIDASVHGDDVLVAPGTYSGSGNQNINFIGKNITLRSEAGPEVTTIEPTGPAPRRAVNLQSGETAASIEGFTLRGGYADWGGAIFCSGASATISNCLLTDNFAVWGSIKGGGAGGGIYCEFGSLSVIDCIIVENYSVDGGLGGAIFAQASVLTVQGCTISDNEAAFGSQIDLFESSVGVVENTIVSFGHQGSIGGQGGSTVSITCSDLFGNEWGDWNVWIASQANQNGNMSLDPLFCDAEGLDLRLSTGSPCLPDGSMGCGLIGALGGCGAVSVPEYEGRSWGAIKGMYRE